jgi:hypothetical protein
MATNTYVALKQTTLTATATEVLFDLTGISGYTDLRLITNVKSTSGTYDITYRFNSDTNTNYSRTILTGNGTTAASYRGTNGTYLRPDVDAYVNSTTWQFVLTDIMNYSNSTTYKTSLSRINGGATPAVEATVGLWRKAPEAITTISIGLDAGSGTFAIGSTFSLYGIAAEVDSTPTTTPPVAGYTCWLDSSDPSSFTYSSGTLVSQWNDKSGNGYHFTQGTSGYQPNRISTIRQNNYPVVTFAGDFLANSSINWGASNSTLFLVTKEDKIAGTGYQNLFTTGTGATGQWGYGISDAGAGDKIGIFDILQGFTAFNSVASTANADILAFTSAGISSGSVTSNLFVNGTADSLNPRTQTSTTSAAGALLGAANTANEPFYGYFCEVLLYPSQLSNTDRNSVEAYLKSKWGIL